MVPCIYCVGNKSISFDSGEFYCQWCKDTKDDSVRMELEKFFSDHEEMLADIRQRDAALTWWFDNNTEEERLEMLKQGIRAESAYENYLSEMADVE